MTINMVYGHLEYYLVAILLVMGLYGMIASTNLMRKVMAMNIMQVAVIVFFISLASKQGAMAPVLPLDENHHVKSVLAHEVVNPLPHALMLTAIVVSVATTGLALALLIRINRHFGSLEESVILEKMVKE